MSRSIFLKTSSSFEPNETPSHPTTNADHTHGVRFHHRLMPTIAKSSRSHETLPVVVVQPSTTTTADSKTIIAAATATATETTATTNTTQYKSVVRANPKMKRNLRGKRRSTGIQPDDATLASALNDVGRVEYFNKSSIFYYFSRFILMMMTTKRTQQIHLSNLSLSLIPNSVNFSTLIEQYRSIL